MAILVWATISIALWHFTVFFPDHFRGGIVGAFGGAVIGGVITGVVWQIAVGDSIGETDVLTAVAPIPGCVLAMWLVYVVGLRDERRHEEV